MRSPILVALRPRAGRGWRLALIAGLLLVGVYAILAGLILPWVLRGQAERRLSALAGGRVVIQSIGFRPFSWVLRVSGVRVEDPQGALLLGWSNLVVDAKLSSLWSGEVRLALVALDGWAVRAVRGTNGSLNLAELGDRVSTELARSSAGDATNTTSPSSPSPGVRIDRVQVTSGQVDFEDHVPREAFRMRLAPIEVLGSNVVTRGPGVSTVSVSIRGDGGELVEVSAGGSPGEGKGEAQLVLRGIGLARGQPYLDPISAVSVTDGVLEAMLPVRVAQEGGVWSAALVGGTMTLSRLAVVGKAGGEPLAGVARLEVRGLDVHPESKEARIEAVKVGGARVTLSRRPGDGGAPETNFRGLIEPELVDRLVADLTDWRFSAGRLEVEEGGVVWRDTTLQPAYTNQLEAIQLLGQDFSNHTNSGPFRVEASLRSGEQGTVRASGQMQLFPARAQARLAIDHLELSQAAPYLAEMVNLSLNRATLETRLEGAYGRASGASPLVRVTGDLAIRDLAATEAGVGTDFIRWEEVALRGLDVALSSNRLALGELALKNLQTSLVMLTNGQLNVMTLLRETRELGEREVASAKPDPEGAVVPSGPPATGAGAPEVVAQAGGPFWETWPVHLGRLSLQGVSLFAGDELYGGGFRTRIESMDGEIRNLGLPATTPAEIDLKGRLTASSGFELAGVLNPDPARFGADLRLEARKADLMQFTPYTVRFAGYPVVGGTLSAQVRYQVEGSALQAENKVLLEGFTLGDKQDSPDAIDLPLKMGLALLKDGEGNVSLDLPLSGSLTDPQFRVAPVLWQAVRNVLLKVVTAPFKMLGSLFGGGAEEDLGSVEFEPGKAVLAEAQTNRLRTLQRALVARPQLALVIEPTIHPKLDPRALAVEALARRLRSLRAEEIGASGAPFPDSSAVVLSPEERTRLLRVAYQREFGALPTALDSATNSAPGATSGIPVPQASAGLPGSSVTNQLSGPVPVNAGASNEPVRLETAGVPQAIGLDPVEERLLETTRIEPEALSTLSRQRAETIRAVLLEGGEVVADRIRLGGEASSAPGEPTVRMQLKLE